VLGGDAPTPEHLPQLSFLDRVVVRAPSAEALPPLHPARDKVASVQGPAAFICSGETCSLPVRSAQEIAASVQAMRG